MADYRTVQMSFWNDPYIEELDARSKLLYIYLFTCSHTSNIGLLEVTRRKISFETGLESIEVGEILGRLERDGKIVTDGNTIWLTKFIKNQTSTSPKMIQGLINLVEKIGSEKIRDSLFIAYPVLKPEVDTLSTNNAGASKPIDTLSKANSEQPEGMDTLSIPYPYPIDTKEEEEEREREDMNTASQYLSAEASPAAGPPPCPHEKIQEQYHELLPELPRMKTWGEVRQRLLRSRWRETWERLRKEGKPHEYSDLLDWWRTYFLWVKRSDFLTGRVPGSGGRTFLADLEWLVKPTNFARVLDGKYMPREVTA